MRRSLWWLLPVLHVTLGVVLGFWGSAQTKSAFVSKYITDYVALPEFILHLINFPVALLICITVQKWNFKIGPEYSTLWFVCYLILIGLFWFLIGWQIGTAGDCSGTESRVRRMGRLFGVLFGVLVLTSGVLLIHSPLGYFVSLAAFTWGISMIILFRRDRLARKKS